MTLPEVFVSGWGRLPDVTLTTFVLWCGEASKSQKNDILTPGVKDALDFVSLVFVILDSGSM